MHFPKYPQLNVSAIRRYGFRIFASTVEKIEQLCNKGIENIERIIWLSDHIREKELEPWRISFTGRETFK